MESGTESRLRFTHVLHRSKIYGNDKNNFYLRSIVQRAELHLSEGSALWRH